MGAIVFGKGSSDGSCHPRQAGPRRVSEIECNSNHNSVSVQSLLFLHCFPRSALRSAPVGRQDTP
jgi:hypothetical protein